MLSDEQIERVRNGETVFVSVKFPAEAESDDILLEDQPMRIEDLKTDILFGVTGANHFPPMAEQYFLLAIAALDQAHRFMQLAHYNRMQGR